VTVKRIKAALTRKLGPLPAWGWATIAFAGVYYWRHRATAAAQTATGTAAGVAAGAGSAFGDNGAGGGGGGGQDQQPLTSPPTDGMFAPVSWDPTQTPAGADPNADTAAPTPAPTTITSGPAPAMISSRDGGGSKPQIFGGQRAAVVASGGAPALAWGGLVFTTQAQFQTWAKLHGTTVRAELARHPAASKVYATLQPAPAAPALTRTKAQTRTRTSTAAPPPAPAARPVSVRSVPAPRVVAHPAAATKPKKAAASRAMPATKAAAAFAPPSRIPGLVPNPVTNPIRTAAPSQAPPRRLAVEAPAPMPANEAFRLLNPVVAAPAPAATRVVAQAPPVLPTVGNETTRVAPRGRMIAV
jgi:hypothetical protein